MPQRRLTALPLALLASAALAGCKIDVAPESIPAPFSVAPIPSASAGQPAYVCTAVYKILTDGAVRLAGYVGGTGDAAKENMRRTFADMAGQVTAAGEKTSDTRLRAAIGEVADSLTAGSRQDDPKAYVDGGFTTVGQFLDTACQ